MDQVTKKISTGGRLYRDARLAELAAAKDAARAAVAAAEPVDLPEEKPAEKPVEPPRPPWAAAPYESLNPDLLEPEPEPRPPWTVKPMTPEPEPEPRRRDWQEIRSTILEVLGMAVLSTGFGMLYLWLGIVVLGVCLLTLGVAEGLIPRQETE